MTPHERETVITSSDGSPFVYIWTCQKKVITRLRKDERFEETGSGEYEIDGTPWAEFRIQADRWNPASGAKRRYNLSEEEKNRRAAEMRAMKTSAGNSIS